jgi:hypothetical protein
MYTGENSASKLCPGETDCEIFQSQLGDYETKLKMTCGGCPMLPTKSTKGKQNAVKLEQILNNIVKFYYQSKSPFPPKQEDLTFVEFVGLQILTVEIEQRERGLRIGTFELLKAFCGVK